MLIWILIGELFVGRMINVDLDIDRGLFVDRMINVNLDIN